MFFQRKPNDRQAQNTPSGVNDEAKLSASKAVSQIAFICQSYGLTAFDGNIDDLKADLATMLAHADLDSVRLELVGGDQRVVFEFEVIFRNATASGLLVDSAKGVEVPLLDRRLVKDRRLIVHRNSKEMHYKLKLNWGSTNSLEKCAGTAFSSEHAARITNGRHEAAFHVSDAARHDLVVTQIGAKGFFFAKDLQLNRDGVFVLLKHLPSGFELRIGARFTALIIATPRGLQARALSA